MELVGCGKREDWGGGSGGKGGGGGREGGGLVMEGEGREGMT